MDYKLRRFKSATQGDKGSIWSNKAFSNGVLNVLRRALQELSVQLLKANNASYFLHSPSYGTPKMDRINYKPSLKLALEQRHQPREWERYPIHALNSIAFSLKSDELLTVRSTFSHYFYKVNKPHTLLKRRGHILNVLIPQGVA